jgi:hypothetical protein
MKMEFLPDGSDDCPLIRLYEFDRAEAVWLREIFDSLANGSRQHLSLHDEPRIEAVGGCQLELRLGRREVGIPKAKRMRFEFTLSPEGWADVASLMDPFCESEDVNGYQWLNERGAVSLLLSPSGEW